jgi:HNH endonuclease
MAEVSAALRREVRLRARERCEYCMFPCQFAGMPYEIDHVVAIKHGGESDLANLAWACWLCNRHKGSDLASVDPLSRRVEMLFNPRENRWSDHFELQEGYILGRTAIGRATSRLLQFNSQVSVNLRADLVQAGLLVLGDKS